MLLYKYRSLKNFKRFVDIIMNNRLYAAEHFKLNDPKEGLYLYVMGNESNQEEQIVSKKVADGKREIRILSLSKDPDNDAMWAHYADDHLGVVIEVMITENDFHKVLYKEAEYFTSKTLKERNYQIGKEVFLRKDEIWSYEKEYRVFTRSDQEFVNVNISKIILGYKIKEEDRTLITRLINCLNKDINVEVSNTFRLWDKEGNLVESESK